VIRPSSLGDVVHALAIVADIRKHRPELAIDWVAEEAYAPLVAMDRGIRHAIPMSFRRWRHHLASRGTWREWSAFRRELRRERYLAILDLQEQVKGALIAAFARGRRHGPDRASIREPVATLAHDDHHAIDPAQHLIDRCRKLAAAALGYPLDGPPRYGIAPPPPAPGAIPDRRYIVAIHATSRDDKRWPDEHWRELIRGFGEVGYAVLLPWGTEDEQRRSRDLARAHPLATVPERLPLVAMASLLARAELAIGVDTGLVHLAAALGIPTVALFTATDPRLAGVERASTIARDLGDTGRIPSVDEARAAAGALLARAPRC
jgi:heptosyltransferase-1